MVRWNPRLSLGRRAAWVGAGCLIATALYLLPGRGDIAPVVADDNAYIFLAADHLYAGEGLTSLPPVAPLQPWEYTTDWAWLTQWPFGYPVLLCVVRGLLGVGTVQAAQIINVAACALALLGWFAFLRRSLPRGILGCLLSLVGAGSSVSVAMLINPSTDVLLVALVPCVLIGVQRIVAGPTDRASENQVDPNTPAASGSQSIAPWVAVGAAAGGLVWFRYAAVFVPIALTLYLGVEVFLARRRRLTDLAGLWAGAALPILVLLLVNASQGTASSVQASVNLGTRIGFDFSPAMLVTAWQRWTDVGFYDYKWYSGLFFAIAVPCVPILLALLSRDYRRRVLEFMAAASYISGAALVASLFSVVMLCSTLFQAKFNFVDLERYYLPIRPLYFLLVVGPLLLLRPRVCRAGLALALLLACSWVVQQEWPRPYRRWLASRDQFTRYGRRATAFSPHGVAVYDWVASQRGRGLILLSNFHDDIALETGEPVLPLPRSVAQLNTWVQRVTEARHLAAPRVRFVIDPDNHYRDYFLPPLDQVVEAFGLEADPLAPAELRSYVYRPRRAAAANAGSLPRERDPQRAEHGAVGARLE